MKYVTSVILLSMLSLVISATFNLSLADEATTSEQPKHPIAKDVLTKLGEDKAFFLHVTFVCKADEVERMKASMEIATEGTRLESANRQYELIQLLDGDHTYRLCEHWTSVQGLDDHLHQDYVIQLLETLDVVMAEPLKLEIAIPLQ